MSPPTQRGAQHLRGTFRLSEPNGPQLTAGGFAEFMRRNSEVLRRYFGCDLFNGSLNVTIDSPHNLHTRFDNRWVTPTFTIPRDDLRANTRGDAQVWRVELSADKIPGVHTCWLMRRIGSGVPPNVLELVSPVGLVATYGLRNDEPMSLLVMAD